jgi:hypothetical protein
VHGKNIIANFKVTKHLQFRKKLSLYILMRNKKQICFIYQSSFSAAV